jgi:aminoglycoside phosphotransferase (APT) family kinase protein
LLAVGSEVTAVIDWEIWSVGDPRIDLGWFLANADPATYARPSSFVDAVPSRGDLLEHYGNVHDVAWFIALACFKSAATWSLIVKHNRRRPTPRADFEEMVPVLPRLLQRARTLLT